METMFNLNTPKMNKVVHFVRDFFVTIALVGIVILGLTIISPDSTFSDIENFWIDDFMTYLSENIYLYLIALLVMIAIAIVILVILYDKEFSINDYLKQNLDIIVILVEWIIITLFLHYEVCYGNNYFTLSEKIAILLTIAILVSILLAVNYGIYYSDSQQKNTKKIILKKIILLSFIVAYVVIKGILDGNLFSTITEKVIQTISLYLLSSLIAVFLTEIYYMNVLYVLFIVPIVTFLIYIIIGLLYYLFTIIFSFSFHGSAGPLYSLFDILISSVNDMFKVDNPADLLDIIFLLAGITNFVRRVEKIDKEEYKKDLKENLKKDKEDDMMTDPTLGLTVFTIIGLFFTFFYLRSIGYL